MTHFTHHLAFAACLTLIGSGAAAAPSRRIPPATAGATAGAADDDVEVSDLEDAADDRAAPVPARERAPKGPRSWHFAIGPNVWMSSVDANVTVGAKSVSAAIGFFDLSRHNKYGIPLLLEGRYKRLSLVADVLYGVIALEGGADVGPLMARLDATVSSLLVDGIAGYRLLGDDHSLVSLEARAGIRYQRTAISGSIDISGNGFSVPAIVDAGADVLASARVFLRPLPRLYLTGAFDQSLFGSSTSTWSAGVDANLRITSYLLLTIGWKTLTQQSALLSTVMHGPRAAVQLLL